MPPPLARHRPNDVVVVGVVVVVRGGRVDVDATDDDTDDENSIRRGFVRGR
jgi:hypothetical protein